MKKKKNNMCLKILGLLFIVFMALYIANMSGYYEGKIRDRVIITDSGIKEFEEKVKNGEEIDITSFLDNEIVDYGSNMSNLGDIVTESIENIVSSGMGFVANVLKSIF